MYESGLRRRGGGQKACPNEGATDGSFPLFGNGVGKDEYSHPLTPNPAQALPFEIKRPGRHGNHRYTTEVVSTPSPCNKPQPYPFTTHSNRKKTHSIN